MLSSGMLRRVALVRTDVSNEFIASIIRVRTDLSEERSTSIIRQVSQVYKVAHIS
jgi:hypothetical protein